MRNLSLSVARRAHFTRNAARSSTFIKTKTGYAPAEHKSNDRRHDVIKRVLFETEPRPEIPPTPEDLARHETIERAWQLYTTQQATQRDLASRAKFERIQTAFEELRQTDYRLFKGAVNKDTTLLFPRAMKAPTETPPTKGWNYSYVPPPPAKSTR
ncbi:hypothetical protein H4R33_001674 [Dimargaris cristalligena]|nr:hypothetical protein H4R33_001674 [Dimargaris cristalligena]